MKKSPRPIVGISKCIGFENCRYNGGRIKSNFIENLKPYVEFKQICPEVEIGLGTPRDPIRLVKIGQKKNLYQPASDRILTNEMIEFSGNFVKSVQKIDGFIFKRGSPSCGIDDARIYHKKEPGCGFDSTSGMFAEIVCNNFPYLVREDDKRLNNITIRDNFLTRLFVMANLREALEGNSFDKLSEFNSKNWLLFLCYSKENTPYLRLLLKNNTQDIKNLAQKYQNLVYKILARIPQKTSILSTNEYVFGLLKSNLSDSEKLYFYKLTEEFKAGLIAQSQVSTLLYSWALRFDIKSVINQSLFNPYPKTLLSDLLSSKREYSIV